MGHQTVERYEQAHLRQMALMAQKYPDLEIRMPWDAPDGAVPYVAGGKWIVRCDCGDYPMASHEWDLARCFGCGAIYRKLAWPRKIREIEAELLKRGKATTRAWFAHETVADLVKQREREEERARVVDTRKRLTGAVVEDLNG